MSGAVLPWVAVLAAPVAVVVAALIANRKLNQIHVLVNDRLDEALGEIERLTAERDATP